MKIVHSSGVFTRSRYVMFHALCIMHAVSQQKRTRLSFTPARNGQATRVLKHAKEAATYNKSSVRKRTTTYF